MQILADFRQYAQYVQEHEPQTLAYHVYNDLNDPNTIYVYER